MEKVTVGGAVDFRHYVYANGQLAAVYSRRSSGTNTVRYGSRITKPASPVSSTAVAIPS
jgi:hypothetical protein